MAGSLYSIPVATAGTTVLAQSGPTNLPATPTPFKFIPEPRSVEPPSAHVTTAVYGQSDFNSDSRGATAATLNDPFDVAVDASGNLLVSDNGNNRVLEFPSNCPSTACAAIRVFGQMDFASSNGSCDRCTATPGRVAIDSGGNV